MQIEAYGAGKFSLNYFTPDRQGPVQFGPVAIQPRDRFTFSFPEMAQVPNVRSREGID